MNLLHLYHGEQDHDHDLYINVESDRFSCFLNVNAVGCEKVVIEVEEILEKSRSSFFEKMTYARLAGRSHKLK